MAITDLLTPETILTRLVVSDKNELFQAMVASFETRMDASLRAALLDAVLVREDVMSTGVGKGFALPHGRCAALDRHMGAFALLDPPLTFDSHHDEPVRFVFMLAGPKGRSGEHIRLMSRISRLFNQDGFRAELSACVTSKDVMRVFKSYEDLHVGS